MEYIFNTRLRGNIALTDSYHTNLALQKDNTLYKFIWVQSGSLQLEIDHVPTTLVKGEIIPLTPLHHIEFKAINGEYLTLLFNSNFYCIFGHDNEVSCNGFLFNGTSNVMQLKLSESQVASLRDITDSLTSEYAIKDNLQEEMLRILLKRFIILCTRIAREKFSVSPEREKAFDMVRQFYVLVDNHFKEKKMVQDYADMLHRSPKTLSNLFTTCGLPSPLRIIHERIEAEAKRLLLYSQKSAKEITEILGFEDQATFSRFFKINAVPLRRFPKEHIMSNKQLFNDPVQRKRYICALLMILLMVGVSELMGEKEIIFPEMAALTIGMWIVDKKVWTVSRLKLVLLMSIGAIVGVCIVRYSPFPLIVTYVGCRSYLRQQERKTMPNLG